MAKKFLFLILFTLTAFNIYAAELKANIENNRAEFVFTFQKGYSAFEQLVDDRNNMIVFTFDTSENISFERQNYFDMPIKSVYLTSKDKKRFFVELKSSIIEPVVNKADKKITITFPFPQIDNKTANQVQQAVPLQNSAVTGSSYAKMLLGLTFVLIIIMLLFWLLKVFFKKQVYTDIPGSGRLLGKVDLELRKSLYFYEIGDIIYILGVTDSNINVIDKIIDDVEATKIRAGFLKKHDFKGYMSFFKRKEGLDDEINSSNAIVEEKLNAIRKRQGTKKV